MIGHVRMCFFNCVITCMNSKINVCVRAAKSMGFSSSPPAYLSLASSNGRLVQAAVAGGVSYASGGAGILDSTVSI